jgi:fumarate reductase subunit C
MKNTNKPVVGTLNMIFSLFFTLHGETWYELTTKTNIWRYNISFIILPTCLVATAVNVMCVYFDRTLEEESDLYFESSSN